MSINQLPRRFDQTTYLKRGFTIVELLIVIVIIAILAAITIVSFNGIQQRARDSERRADISSIQKLVEVFFLDNQRYPYTSEMQNPTWRAENLITRDQGSFINPQDAAGSTSSMTSSGSIVTINKYSYYEVPLGDGSTGYRITYKLESAPTTNVNISVNK